MVKIECAGRKPATYCSNQDAALSLARGNVKIHARNVYLLKAYEKTFSVATTEFLQRRGLGLSYEFGRDLS